MARGLQFRIQKVEGLFYSCSENKDADMLRGYREADLRLCFRICKNAGFLTTLLRVLVLTKSKKEYLLNCVSPSEHFLYA